MIREYCITYIIYVKATEQSKYVDSSELEQYNEVKHSRINLLKKYWIQVLTNNKKMNIESIKIIPQLSAKVV